MHLAEAYRSLARPSSALEPSHPLVGIHSVCPTELSSPEPSGTAVRTVSYRGLNTSLPRCVHPDSIKLVFYERP